MPFKVKTSIYDKIMTIIMVLLKLEDIGAD